MPSIKPFLIAAGAGLIGLIVSAMAGNAIYGSNPTGPVRTGQIALGVAFFGSLLAMVYSAVPLLIRAFVLGQIKIGNGEVSMVRWLTANERVIWFVVWGIWTLGLLISLPFAIKEWRR